MSSSFDFAFLDSGTGGIPYMLALKQKCADYKCVYVGDTANFPYGQKTPQQVIDAVTDIAGKIIKKWNPPTIVIACNTMSVTALDAVRKTFPNTAFVGTVPAIKLAAKMTSNKNIGFLATNGTVNHPYSKKLIEDFASDCHVFSRGDPDLIEFIEHKLFVSSKEERLKAVEGAVKYFKDNNCDTVILGCTHFTHIYNEMVEACGSEVQVIDSREGVARQAIHVEEIMKQRSEFERNTTSAEKDMSFYVTALNSQKEEEEYKRLSSVFGIPFCGLLSF